MGNLSPTLTLVITVVGRVVFEDFRALQGPNEGVPFDISCDKVSAIWVISSVAKGHARDIVSCRRKYERRVICPVGEIRTGSRRGGDMVCLVIRLRPVAIGQSKGENSDFVCIRAD